MYREHVWLWDSASRKYVYFPCLSTMQKPCWLCQQNAPADRVMMMTAIDCTGFVVTAGKDAGKHIANLKRLLVITEKSRGVFIRHQERLRSLKYQEFEVARSPGKTPSIGDDWQQVGVHTAEELKASGIDITPYEYEKIIPFNLTAEDQERFFRSNPSVSWKSKNDRSFGNSPAPVAYSAPAAPVAPVAPVAPAVSAAPVAPVASVPSTPPPMPRGLPTPTVFRPVAEAQQNPAQPADEDRIPY